MRLLALAAVALAVLVTAPGPAFSASRSAGPPGSVADRPSAGPPAFASPAASRVASAPFAVLATTSLLNGTTFPGAAVLPGGNRPVAIADDAPDLRLFVLVDGPPAGVVVVDPTNGTLLGFWSLELNGSALPTALAFDARDDRLLVADGAADSVTIFGADNGSRLAEIDLGPGADASGLALDPENDTGYVAEAGLGAVVAVNVSTGRLGPSVVVGGAPTDVLYDPYGEQILVADSNGSSVDSFRPGAPSTVATSAVGLDPDGLAYDPANAQVLVANAGSANVTVLNRSTLAPEGSYAAGPDPGALTVSTRGIAYVPEPGTDNLSVIDDANGTVLRPLAAGADPVAATWDPSDGLVYVANAGSDNLSEVGDAAVTGAGSLPVGSDPLGAAPLPNGTGFEVAVASADGLAAIGMGSADLGPLSTVAGAPQSLALDAPLDRVDATIDPTPAGNGSLAVLDPSDHSVTMGPALGAGPAGIAYDPGSGDLWVADLAGRSVEAVDPSEDRVVATLAVPGEAGRYAPTADQIAIDPTDSIAAVTAGSSNASVLLWNTSTDAVVATLAMPAGPTGVAFDPDADAFFVADVAAQSVTEIDPATASVLGSLSLGARPYGIAYDAADGLLYVTEPDLAQVVSVDPSSRSVVGSYAVGTFPCDIAYDPASAELLVSDPGQGSVTLLGPEPPTYPVEFAATGLPGGPPGWIVRVDGVRYGSDNATIDLREPNGTHRFSIAPEPPLDPDPTGGTFNVSGALVVIPVQFAPADYNVTFRASGLPAGTFWWVSLSSGENQTTTLATLSFDEPNGTYDYSVGATDGYAPAAGTDVGAVTVSGGAPSAVRVAFVAGPPYVLTFESVGLPADVVWSVFLEGGASVAGDSAALSFAVFNGTFEYSVPTADGLPAHPAAGSVTVSGASPPPVRIVFGASFVARYEVSFVGIGLSEGVGFAINVSGEPAVAGTTGAAAAFSLPNGSYSYAVVSPSGWLAAPGSGTFRVDGRPLTINVSFALPPPAGGIVAPRTLAVLAAGGLGAAGVAVALVLYRRRPGAIRVVEAELVRSGPPREAGGAGPLGSGPSDARGPPESEEGPDGPVSP